MDAKLRKKIINKYKKGKGSTTIEKELNISKPTILKILREENLIRKRDRCSSIDIKQDGNIFYVIRKCPNCDKDIKTISKDKVIACRNHINKMKGTSLCKPCALKLQVGEGNPFYGKKHTKETIKKISENRKGKYCGEKNHMKKEKYRELSKSIMTSNWEKNILDRKVISEQMKETRRLGKIKSTITSKKETEIINILSNLGVHAIQSFRIDSKVCDIYIPSYNLIIEYFGDYWHCNPKKYDENYFNQKKGLHAKEIWDYDNNKIDLIKNYGYNLEVIWESDFKNDNKLINQIIEKYVKSK